MRILLIETSQQPGFVAVAEERRLLAVHWLDEARRHARDLAPSVSELLNEQGWRPSDVQVVVVSRGPGSYTGLRVGIMSAKAFAYATGCTLLGVETFAVIAAQAPAEMTRLTVLGDAQQDKVYVQEFERDAPVTALQIKSFHEWVAGEARELHVSGPGLRKWSTQLPGHVRAVSADLWNPQPESLLRLAWQRCQRGERDDVWAAEPIYLRPSSAEEKWKQKGSSPA